MTNQQNKTLVWQFWQAINMNPADVNDLLKANCHHNIVFDGPHPINQLADPDGIAEGFWQPFYAAFPDMVRQPYIFMGGESFDGTTWVSSTGDFIGTFADTWLGIPASGQTAHIRYGEFCKIYDGKIGEQILLLDIPDLCVQVGLEIFPPNSGATLWIPGPQSGEGILLDEQDPADGAKSLSLVNAMLYGLGSYDQDDKASMGQVNYWHENMLWYGPSGIGTTHGLKGFEDHHQLPWLHAFPDRKGGHHRARFGESVYACSTGWPSMYATHLGEYLGIPATGNRVTMRVMDWWQRENDLLVENWVFIDLIDLFLQFGIDLFQVLRKQVIE